MSVCVAAVCLWRDERKQIPRCFAARNDSSGVLHLNSAGVCRVLLLLSALFIVFTAAGCNRETGNTNTRSAESSNSVTTTGFRRDLSQDEARGGHTLKRHVGRTDAELEERLQREPSIGAASTYTDRKMAEEAVGAAINANQGKVSRWTERSGRHPNLVLEYNASQPVGRTLHRGDSDTEACSHVLVVLKFDGHGEYHVLTSYPECR
jgi:hypothetical protein